MADLQLFKIAVSAFVLRDGKLLVLKRADDEDFLPGKWEVPGGGIDQGETIEQGVLRETMEEAGLTVQVKKLIGHFEYVDRHEQKTINLNFLCTMERETDEADVSSGEMTEMRWVSLQELDEIPFTSETMEQLCKEALTTIA